eukprot:gene19417-21341_t
MFGAANSSQSERPVSWAFSDDILDRNIDQLDRETPRCNLSEDEEEELDRSKLTMKSHKPAPPPLKTASSAAIATTGWLSQQSRLQQTNLSAANKLNSSNNPTSPSQTELAPKIGQQKENCAKSLIHNSMSTSVLTSLNGPLTSSIPITHSSSFNGSCVSMPPNSMAIGYTSPTSTQMGAHSSSSNNLGHLRSPCQQHVPLSTNQQQQQHISTANKLFSNRTLPVVSMNGSSMHQQQKKPLGMVTPQMPPSKGGYAPAQGSGMKQGAVSAQIAYSQSKAPTQLLSHQPTAVAASAVTSTAQQHLSSPSPQLQSTAKEGGSKFHGLQPPQTAKIVPRKQQPYRPLAGCTNDQLKRIQGHVESYCRIPNCVGCLEVRKLKDDPKKKAQLIRQVEDEILLRSRELDSCWQEDELDCVRDFTDMDRRKEMTYAETSEEGIFKRVSDEIIKRPPLWHDEEVDSVKDYSERKCGQQGEVSKIGSEEKVCLSPPWNEAEEELLAREPGVAMTHQVQPITSSMQMTQSTSASSSCVTTTSSQMPFYMNLNEVDSVKDYTSTYNNGQELGSRIPSSERISLTPPWTPSGCQTPAEGVPVLEKPPVSTPASISKPSSQSINPADSNCRSISTNVNKIDTSGVQMRNKSRNNSNRTAHCAPYVVPRFDEMDEDSVKDYSAPSRQLQALSSKIPSYEYLPFTPPWISNNNSGISTPLNCAMDLPQQQQQLQATPASKSSNAPASLPVSSTSIVTGPPLPTKSSTSNEVKQSVPPVLSNFRNNDRMYYDTYGETPTGVDSIRNFSMGLLEETSRIPSCEQLCYTPPWMEGEDESEHIAENESRQQLTLEEQRVIQEEARKSGTEQAEAKAHEQRNQNEAVAVDAQGQPIAPTGLPGRDSGFCSEQDQKQKQQQQQQNEENGLTIDEVVNSNPSNAFQTQFKPSDYVIKPSAAATTSTATTTTAANPEKEVSASPDRCWSSKESSGSNQTDISTIVNPATSVPITAPGSPDPDGSEATNTDVSDNEANVSSPPVGGGASGVVAGKEQQCNVDRLAAANSTVSNTAAQQQEQKYPAGHAVIEDSYQMQYGYRHMPSQGLAPPQQHHHTFPRSGLIQTDHSYYNPTRLDAAAQMGFAPAVRNPNNNNNSNYANISQHQQSSYGNEVDRPRLQVPPYSTLQYGNAIKEQQPHGVGYSRGSQPPAVGGGMQEMRYQGMRYCQPGLRNPLQHTESITPQQQQQQQHMHPSSMHRMPFQLKDQRSPQLLRQGQRSAFEANPKGQQQQQQQPPTRYYSNQLRVNEAQPPPGYVGRPPPGALQMDAAYVKNMVAAEEGFKGPQVGLLKVATQSDQKAAEDKAPMQPPGPLRSISQTNLQQQQQQNQDLQQQQQQTNDNISVVSFSSMAASHQNLDTKVDMVSSLLSMLGTHDKDDVARTLLAMSSSTDSCSAMRQSGCLPLLIKLLHDPAYESQGINWEARNRAGLALHNIINSGRGDRKGRREVRVLRLIEIVRAHSEAALSGNMDKYHRSAPALREHGPGPAVAALMKLSFEEEHKNTITELGGLQVMAELLQVDFKLNGQCNDPYSITLRKYAGMTLINLTYSDGKNKNRLLEMSGALKGVVTGLASFEEEDLVQVSAGIIRNVSWRCDEAGKRILAEIDAARSLMLSCQNICSEGAIRSVLSAVWNLSAHSPENKESICATPGSLQFLCYALNYRSPSRSLVIPENAGGILRNISSHIAIKPEYRAVLREHGCLKVLISHLRSPSTRVVSNSCGILWNLSARCMEDQELLWELGAVSMLKTLVNSKHKSISTSSASALRNLMAVKPGGSSTDTESHASFQFRRSNTLPGKSRTQPAQASRNERRYKSFFGTKKNVTTAAAMQKDASAAPSGAAAGNASNDGVVNEKKQAGNAAAATSTTFRQLQHSHATPEDVQGSKFKVHHRKVKGHPVGGHQGEPHYYADLYQDPPRRGITMPHNKDPTTILYHSSGDPGGLQAQGQRPAFPKDADVTVGNEGLHPMSATHFPGGHVERWNQSTSFNCKHTQQQQQQYGKSSSEFPVGVNQLQQGIQDMQLRRPPFIASRQRKDSSSSSSSFSSPSQPHASRSGKTSETAQAVFRERRPNGGALSLHRRSMSDTISDFGHPPSNQQSSADYRRPLHAVTDSELAKRDHFGYDEFREATGPHGGGGFRKDAEHASWHDLFHREQPIGHREQTRSFREPKSRREPRGFREPKGFRDPRGFREPRIERENSAPGREQTNTAVGKSPNAKRELFETSNSNQRGARRCYETHFLSPYDDCPLSSVNDVIGSSRPGPKASDRIAAPASTTPKVFVQETRYDVREALHRRSNETIASYSSMGGFSSQEDLKPSVGNRKSCNHHNHNLGASVWQCGCYETSNVWVRKQQQQQQQLQFSNEQQCRAVDGRTPCGNDPRMQCGVDPRMQFGVDPRMPCGADPRMYSNVADKLISSPQGQFGLATPLKDPHANPGLEMTVFKPTVMESTCKEGEKLCATSQGHSLSQGHSVGQGNPLAHCNPLVEKGDKKAMLVIGSDAGTDSDANAKKPLRSSLKTPSDSLRKFRKKHVTQKVVTSLDKKKESKAKDNVMVTSL